MKQTDLSQHEIVKYSPKTQYVGTSRSSKVTDIGTPRELVSTAKQHVCAYPPPFSCNRLRVADSSRNCAKQPKSQKNKFNNPPPILGVCGRFRSSMLSITGKFVSNKSIKLQVHQKKNSLQQSVLL